MLEPHFTRAPLRRARPIFKCLLTGTYRAKTKLCKIVMWQWLLWGRCDKCWRLSYCPPGALSDTALHGGASRWENECRRHRHAGVLHRCWGAKWHCGGCLVGKCSKCGYAPGLYSTHIHVWSPAKMLRTHGRRHTLAGGTHMAGGAHMYVWYSLLSWCMGDITTHPWTEHSTILKANVRSIIPRVCAGLAANTLLLDG